jgi:twinkle protein
MAGLIEEVESKPLTKRKLSQETLEHFGYGVADWKGKTVQVAPYFDAEGTLVAQHLRTADKEMPWVGDASDAMPFGYHCFPHTGRKLVLTEGELDAMSFSQVQDNKWPVWSIGCGAGPQVRKYIARVRDALLQFDEVVIMFDMDPPGREAAKVAAEVIGPKARIAELPLKDANEMLVADRADEMVRAMWNAKAYSPEGIVNISDLEGEVFKGVEWGLPWPWPSLTQATYGRRLGEIYMLGAGTGIGKTDVFSEIVAHTITELGEPAGVFFLEQQPAESALRLCGKIGNRPFHVPDGGWTKDELVAAWKKLKEAKQVYLYDSFGVNEWDAIENRIRFLRHAHDVRHFFVDHLTALAASLDDERKALEVIMAKMGGLVKELNIAIYCISHLATPEGKPHEEGGRVMIRHFKGSRSIGFWSHFMFGLERDQQSDDLDERTLTTFRVLKDRYTGRGAGVTFGLRMDMETGRLYEAQLPSESDFKDETKEDF